MNDTKVNGSHHYPHQDIAPNSHASTHPPGRRPYERLLDQVIDALTREHSGVCRPALPVELALKIVSYLPPVLFSHTYIKGDRRIQSSSTSKISEILLSISELPSSLMTLRIRVRSHDQGWADYSSEAKAASWSWCEVALNQNCSRPQAPLPNSSHKSTWICYHNRLADRRSHLYEVVFPAHHELCTRAKQGDQLALFASVQFHGWCNYISFAEMFLYGPYQLK
jgi:hypothetical protein